MVTYTVHEPLPPAAALRDRAANVVFTKEGVSWPGLVLGAPWLLVHGLWLEFLAVLAISIAVGGAIFSLTGSMDAASWSFTFFNLIVGFELFNLKRWELERRGHELIGLVSARDFDECERRFFQNWSPLAGHGQDMARPSVSGASARQSGDREVIGFLSSDARLT